ncbi:uncharacterized protein LOC129729414 [Wyeomyia smithii]|uniref:uncharacterized protein LOC129729414 n=1 Tax=Wyeomyia smithii TaxID=174621 RepID=UPI002467BE57|nr:uncharacterized protein LOC129729414 [Wyeomyia smithii]
MADKLISDLELPKDLINILMNDCDLGLSDLIKLNFEQFQSCLESTGIDWCCRNIFDKIDAWRQRNRSSILKLLQSNQTLEALPVLPGAETDFCDLSVAEETNGINHKNIPIAIEVLQQGSNIVANSSKQLEKYTQETECISKLEVSESACFINEECQTSCLTPTCPVIEFLGFEHEASNTYSTETTVRQIFSPKVFLKLLADSETGKEIVQRASVGELSEAKQLQLAGIIAKYHLKLNKKLTSDDLQNYSLAVVTLFNKEKQENYYIPRGGDRKNAGGKIANKIGNLRQRKRKNDMREEQHAKKFEPISTTVSSSINEATQWLMLNQEPLC